MGEQTRPPDKCAACDETAGIQWLRMVTDWEDYLSTHRDVSSPESVCLIPLCNRCRAWAEIIEIAEMAVPQLPDGEANRILQERDHFLESLDVHLVRGLRVSHQLESFNE